MFAGRIKDDLGKAPEGYEVLCQVGEKYYRLGRVTFIDHKRKCIILPGAYDDYNGENSEDFEA